MINKTVKIFIRIALFIIILLTSFNKAYAANTDYFDNKQKKEKGIGVAVIEREGTDVKSYFYLYYDNNGEVHTVQYMLNPMSSEYQENSGLPKNVDKKKWILKTDADNSKAKELGAKEYYTSQEEIEKDENKTATALYKTIEKKVGNTNGLYDYIEGTDDNLEPYTIESIIFNEVPLFDVNVFSETAGGKEIKEDSPIGIIRKLVAIWFVSFRNITLVSLVILIVYYGIRIAIATVANDKAHYKEMLFSWLKSLILALFVHVIMYAILSFNELLVDSFKNVNEEEVSIYNTIRTRALETPWKVGIPATILYITLLIMWVRFIWAYFKRLFTVTFLIILSPLVIIRYAVQSASGKGSQMVSNLIRRFATAVLIQAIHAMLYVAFVESALKLALDNMYGFFIALFFLNFILSADALVTGIFKSEFDPGLARDMDKPFKPREQLAGAYITYSATKKFVGALDNVTEEAGRIVKTQAYKGYLKTTDYLDDKFGGNHRDKIETYKNNMLNKIDDLFITDVNDEDIEPYQLIKRAKNKLQKETNDIFTLRKLSRMKGITGANAKRTLKLKTNSYRKSFRSNFKIIKDIGIGSVEAIFAIPVTVNNIESGIFLMSDIPVRFSESRKSMREKAKKSNSYNKHLDDVVHNLRTANNNVDIINEQLDRLSEEDRAEAIQTMRRVDDYNINIAFITYKIRDYVIRNNIQEIDDSILEDIVTVITQGIPGDISDEDRALIKDRAIENIRQNADDNIRASRHDEEEDEEDNRYESSENHQRGQLNEEEITDSEAGQGTLFDANLQSEQVITDRARAEIRGEENAQEHTDEEETLDRGKQQTSREQRNVYNFSDIAEAIEDAVIETKVDSRFAEVAKAMDSIKDMNMREERKENSEGEVINVNRFLNDLDNRRT